jgi:hypothetical protein
MEQCFHALWVNSDVLPPKINPFSLRRLTSLTYDKRGGDVP